MMLLEYEGKQLLRSVGIRVPDGLVIESPKNLLPLLRDRRFSFPTAIKAQIASGGRGKIGGVLRADNEDQAAAAVAQIFSSQFNGECPGSVLIEPWLAVEQEMYLSVAVDGGAGGYTILFSARGGMKVEEGILPAKYAIGAPWRYRSHAFRVVLEKTDTDLQTRERIITLAQNLVAVASSRDCTTIEINPLAKLADGDLVALDAKVVFDEWAAFRNRTILEHKQSVQKRLPELLRDCLAMKHMYVRLNGSVGLISGGAGMTMAAMDLIQEFGEQPACFLDCSPGPASATGYRPAFALLDADAQVRVILVSIYGGGTQMQRVARALMELMRERNSSSKPVVFRLNGTHVDQVPAIFAEFGAKNHAYLEDAVAEAVALARKTNEHPA
jgi:succinyl-CoA synthetase beta subunit